QLSGGNRWRDGQTACARRRKDETGAGAGVDRGRLPALEQRDRRVEVVDLQEARNVGAAEPELSRCAQGVGQGSWRLDGEDRAVVTGRRDARPVPELDPEGSIGEAPLDLTPQRAGAREWHG